MGKTAQVSVYDIEASADAATNEFARRKLATLAREIQQLGRWNQPILVLRNAETRTRYEIAFGELAFQAAKQSGQFFVEVIDAGPMTRAERDQVREIDQTDLDLLDVIEQGETFARMKTLTGLGVRQLGRLIGRSHSEISRKIRYLQLPERVREEARRGTLRDGHLKLILARPSQVQEEVGIRAAIQGWTVKELRSALAGGRAGEKGGKTTSETGDMSGYLSTLARRIGEHLGAEVGLETHRTGRSLKMTISFTSQETLGGVLEQLGARLDGADDLDRWRERGSLTVDVPRWEMLEELLREEKWT